MLPATGVRRTESALVDQPPPRGRERDDAGDVVPGHAGSEVGIDPPKAPRRGRRHRPGRHGPDNVKGQDGPCMPLR